ncbi:MAG TPA: endo-1,4-beta-xylanase [Rhizomicrobium sp.]|nr:endo-1,4-beta-xylanase [Rhizomicrobium sp.]
MGAARAAQLRPAILDDTPAGLGSIAARHRRLYGTAVSTFELADGAFAHALAGEAAILVPEYEMKRNVVERVRGTFDLSACDRILAFAHAHGMKLRGHPLVWHRRNPDWLEEAVRASRDDSLIVSYIDNVVRHFRGDVHSWDVVNEAIAPTDGRSDFLRRTFWLDAFGPAYIDLAFHAAKSADPDALLVYNDWGCELGGPANDTFRAATLGFLEGALARGVPIEGLGLQGHLRAFGTPVDAAKLGGFLAKVRGMGLRILVTEHDVDDSGGPLDIARRDSAVADASRRFLDVMIEGGSTMILTWGLSDRFLDPPDLRQRLAGYSPRMLPLDRDFHRKPMWHAIAGALSER